MRFEGTLISVVRFPVKSMAGESLQEGVLTRTGLQNDRLYVFLYECAFRDAALVRQRASGDVGIQSQIDWWPGSRRNANRRDLSSRFSTTDRVLQGTHLEYGKFLARRNERSPD